MPTHSTAARNAATNAVVDLIDAGAGANGTLVILDGGSPLATHNFAATAFGDSSGGTATANTIADATASDTGTADVWQAKDGDGTLIVSGVVGMKRAIAAVATGAGGTFSVATDLTAEFAAGTKFTVTGSSNNNGTWHVHSVTYSAPNTVITVEADETVGATADGYAAVGQIGLDNTSIADGQTVTVSSLTYTALPT